MLPRAIKALQNNDQSSDAEVLFPGELINISVGLFKSSGLNHDTVVCLDFLVLPPFGFACVLTWLFTCCVPVLVGRGNGMSVTLVFGGTEEEVAGEAGELGVLWLWLCSTVAGGDREGLLPPKNSCDGTFESATDSTRAWALSSLASRVRARLRWTIAWNRVDRDMGASPRV